MFSLMKLMINLQINAKKKNEVITEKLIDLQKYFILF